MAPEHPPPTGAAKTSAAGAAARTAAAAPATTPTPKPTPPPTPPPPPPAANASAKDAGAKLDALLSLLREEAERAPRYGLNGKALVLNAARAVGAFERDARAGRVAAAAARLREEDASARRARPAGGAAERPPPPSLQQQRRQGETPPTAPAPRLSPAQLLARVPTAARPFLPYRPRAFLPLAERQAVVDRLVGLHLRALLRELGLPDGACEGDGPGVSRPPPVRGGARPEAAAAAAAAPVSDKERRARQLWRAAAAAALAQERRAYSACSSKPAYVAATLRLEADAGLWAGAACKAEVDGLRRPAAAAAGGGGAAAAAAGAAAGAAARRFVDG